METIQMIQKAATMGRLAIGSFITTTCSLTHHISCRVFLAKSNHPGDSAPYSPDLVPWDFWLFPKLKSQGTRFQTANEIQENMMGQLMAIGWTVWGPKVAALKVTEASLSYAQCFLYLVSSSISVSIFLVHGWIPSGQTSYVWKRKFNRNIVKYWK